MKNLGIVDLAFTYLSMAAAEKMREKAEQEFEESEREKARVTPKRPCRRFTKEETDYLIANYQDMSVPRIAKKLDRNQNALYLKVARMGLKKRRL